MSRLSEKLTGSHPVVTWTQSLVCLAPYDIIKLLTSTITLLGRAPTLAGHVQKTTA